MMKQRLLSLALLFCAFGTLSVFARPYFGDTLSFQQPDGKYVSVRIFGNEYYQDVESLDGYTLVRDNETNYIVYALLDSDGMNYHSSGIVYHGAEAPVAVRMIVEPGIRIKPESIKAKIAKARAILASPNEGNILKRGLDVSRPKVLPDTVIGVTVLIDFPDRKSNITKAQIEEFLNGDNYTGFGNARSIKEYFQWISSGKLTYINKVTDFYTAPKNKNQYDYGSKDNEYHADALFADAVVPALTLFGKEGIAQLSKQSNDRKMILAINVLYAGNPDAGWARGIWPHQGSMDIRLPGINENSSGVPQNVRQKYQMTNIGSSLSVNTFIHENGHLVCGWPDFYSYDGHSDNNAGRYNVGGPADFGNNEKNPGYPNPYILDAMGWLDERHDITNANDGRTITLHARPGSAAVFKGTRGNMAPQEMYYMQVRYPEAGKPERYSGMMIWHVNLQGDCRYTGNAEELDCRPATLNDPCFKSTLRSEFNDLGDPSAKWHGSRTNIANPKNSLIRLWRISPAGYEMSFRAGTNIPNPELETRYHAAAVGIFNRDSLTLLGGSAPYKFTLTQADALPEGLELDTTGVLYGNPTKAGDYTIPINIKARYSQANDTIYLHIGESTQYSVRPYSIPQSRIVLTNYDKGGEGIAYHDTDTRNSGNANFRPTEYVDISSFTGATLRKIADIQDGEWLQYTCNVTDGGEYEITIDYATPDENNIISLYSDGIRIATDTLPSTGTAGNNFSELKSYSFSARVRAGLRRLRLQFDNASNIVAYRLGFECKIPDAVASIETDTDIALHSDNGGTTISASTDMSLVKIISVSGAIVAKYTPNAGELTLDNSLPRGIYLLRITTAAGTKTLKWLK